MSNLAELKDKNRRWTILKLLAGDVGHVVEAGLIQRGVVAINRAHNVGIDQIRIDLNWLSKLMLVELEFEDAMVFARLTQRGDDVAAGRTLVDGVDEPPLN